MQVTGESMVWLTDSKFEIIISSKWFLKQHPVLLLEFILMSNKVNYITGPFSLLLKKKQYSFFFFWSERVDKYFKCIWEEVKKYITN